MERGVLPTLPSPNAYLAESTEPSTTASPLEPAQERFPSFASTKTRQTDNPSTDDLSTWESVLVATRVHSLPCPTADLSDWSSIPRSIHQNPLKVGLTSTWPLNTARCPSIFYPMICRLPDLSLFVKLARSGPRFSTEKRSPGPLWVSDWDFTGTLLTQRQAFTLLSTWDVRIAPSTAINLPPVSTYRLGPFERAPCI